MEAFSLAALLLAVILSSAAPLPITVLRTRVHVVSARSSAQASSVP